MIPVFFGGFMILMALVASISPLINLIFGVRSTAVILTAEYKARYENSASIEGRDFGTCYTGEYKNKDGKRVPFEYWQNDKNFGASKAKGDTFEVLYRPGKEGSLMEADFIAMFRLSFALLAFGLVVIYIWIKK